jgi:hypothetical protein
MTVRGRVLSIYVYGKYFALGVQPDMGPVKGALQRVEVKAFDLIVAFHGAEKGAIAWRFELIDTGFAQPFVAQGLPSLVQSVTPKRQYLCKRFVLACAFSHHRFRLTIGGFPSILKSVGIQKIATRH